MFSKISIVYFILFYKRVFLLKSIHLFLFQHSDCFMLNCERKMSKRKQQTLGYFGIYQKRSSSWKEQKVKVPNFIDAEEGIKLISCLHCPQKFKISQDLAFTLNANMQGKFY